MLSSIRSAALLVALACTVPPAQAQLAPPRDAPPPRATLEGWERRARVSMRDRLHAHGGLFFDRGLFRQLTPAMDHEYDIDLVTIGFTPRENAVWLDAPIAFRMQAGSISRGRFAHRVDVRVRADVGRGRVWLDAIQEEDVQAQRLFSEIGGSLPIGDQHTVGATQTFGHFKPDLDFTLFYAYRAAQGRAVVRLEALDIANDFIFATLGSDPSLEDTVRVYDRSPVGVTASYSSNASAQTRVEAYGGVQPLSSARIDVAGEAPFRFYDGMAYGAFLAEHRIGRWRAGLFGRVQHSRVRRTEASGEGYRSAQNLGEVGALLAASWPRLTLDAMGSIGTYADVQRGADFSSSTISRAFAYRERRLMARLGAYVPITRWLGVNAIYVALGRRGNEPDIYAGFLTFSPWAPNGRFSAALTARHDRVELALGGSIDLGGDPFFTDGRGLTRYDGGYVRLSVLP